MRPSKTTPDAIPCRQSADLTAPLQSILDSVGIPACAADLDSNTVLCTNAAARRAWGEGRGLPWWEAAPCGGKDSFTRAQRDTDGAAVWQHTDAPTGRSYEFHGRILRLTDGRDVRIVSAVDTTAVRRDAEALAESEQELLDIIQNLPDPTFAIDLKGRVIAWNRAIEELTGIPAADMIGRGDCACMIPFYGRARPGLIHLAIRPGSELGSRYRNVQRDGRSLMAEVRVPALRPGGVELWLKATPLYDSHGQLIGGIESLRDITDRKQAQRDLARKQAALEEANQALERKNTALVELMETIQAQRAALSDAVGQNVERAILPMLHQLRQGASQRWLNLIEQIEAGLREITSPFVSTVANAFACLSAKELRICTLIRRGLTTKEIAEMEAVSTETVKTHRQRIRRKLRLGAGDVNLATYLQNLTADGQAGPPSLPPES
ncbi:MAG: PAS domain S-box protein [Planctomycetes bacterium]|nr:PAS domain S-box protein [Planctomycetota bacterium]